MRPGFFKSMLACGILVLAVSTVSVYGTEKPIVIGSKKFTESVILAELAGQLIASTGAAVIYRRDMGGTRILWGALLKGDIDIYPEYTGTLLREILVEENISGMRSLAAHLRQRGLGATGPLGFDNTYVLGVSPQTEKKHSLKNISDLRKYPRLRFGFSNEFMNRRDGWPGLRSAYSLPQQNVRGLDHDLAYRGLESGSIDVIDLYATDAEIDYYGIARLNDDKKYFPEYKALYLYRLDMSAHHPNAMKPLAQLEGRITTERMSQLNAMVKIQGETESQAAADFIKQALDVEVTVNHTTALDRFIQHSKEHLALVAVSLTAAIFIAIPAGIASARNQRLGQVLLGAAGLIQTIPSLALFVFMIPLLGIGGPPAIVALFLYSLLPIMRNTYSGLHDIPLALRESAIAIGLPKTKRLLWVELPLAARSILAGVKTSAVINVGTATLGALIGAGGYGQPILTGIRLDDVGLILQGALPAAGLALLAQGLFELIERVLLPRSLRYQEST